ncbi:uncharacterized protein LOC129804457 isoform X1 [Phlebotomus papatasi]|uniref:uncharacterized protein LOC129804457 isoform X1 n=1 Tax=Phlebotomus papatasi TaxID=29031 RepID=UPI0024834E1B|nr:uncharacterized protein LOC129804457 isoform X1 [Phlebotomus papatasi]
MINSDTKQGVYAPLCQTMSDSESEEELLHRNHHHARLQSKSTNPARTPSNLNRIENHLMFSTTEILGNYSNVEGGHVPASWTNTLPEKKGMSGGRKILFFLSIGLCIFVTVGFLWLLPCSDSATCSSGEKKIKTHNWLRDYEKIELKGIINTVTGLKGRGKNLIFMYRSDRVFAEFDENDHHTNGIISLIGRGGQVAWYDEMPEEPKSIDCTLLDVDKNGEADCLIVGQMGQLGALDPVSGEWLWHISPRIGNSSKIPEDAVDFPLILPDLDGDGVKDLLQIGPSETNQHNSLFLISGATGRILGKSYTVAECESVHKLTIDRNFRINLSCWRNESSVSYVKSLDDLYRLWTNNALKVDALSKPETIEQHRLLGQRKNTENQINIYPSGGKELIIENRGKCPHHCNMTVRLMDEKQNHEVLIRNGTGIYGMVPTILSLNTTKSTLNGFIVKFWEWTPAAGEFFRKRREFPEIIRNHTHSPLEPILRMRVLREVVLMILFNSTDTRVINTSQNNIVQFCLEEHGEEIFCQPDLNYQENSLLIADLDEDGSQELISYYTTFISSDNEKENWRLITYVQLLRLESELAKLNDSEGLN